MVSLCKIGGDLVILLGHFAEAFLPPLSLTILLAEKLLLLDLKLAFLLVEGLKLNLELSHFYLGGLKALQFFFLELYGFTDLLSGFFQFLLLIKSLMIKSLSIVVNVVHIDRVLGIILRLILIYHMLETLAKSH